MNRGNGMLKVISKERRPKGLLTDGKVFERADYMKIN